jgi:lipoprotein-releasing system ATP-binding protein
MQENNSQNIIIKASGITKSFGAVSVLKGVDIEVSRGEMVSIIGASGAGKSTLLQILGTLDVPDGGKVFFKEQSLFDLSESRLAEMRNKSMGFVFQFHNLLPEFSALENVCLPGMIAGRQQGELEQKAKALIDYLGLSHRIHARPQTLSGGEQQRISVARALINDPEIIFADEPSGNLDSHNAEELHQLFYKLKNDLHKTFVIVTHNEKLAQGSDRIIEMKDGKVFIPSLL